MTAIRGRALKDPCVHASVPPKTLKAPMPGIRAYAGKYGWFLGVAGGRTYFCRLCRKSRAEAEAKMDFYPSQAQLFRHLRERHGEGGEVAR